MKTQAKITGFRKVKNGAFQMEVSQVVDTRTTVNSGSLLGMLNEGDERFENNGPKARKAWTKVTAESAKKYFNIDITSLNYDKDGKAIVSIENPQINGLDLGIKITESTSMEYLQKACGLSEESINLLIDNSETKAKHTPASETREAMYFVKDGQLVYSLTNIVAGEAKHELVADATMTPASEFFTSIAKVAESIKA